MKRTAVTSIVIFLVLLSSVLFASTVQTFTKISVEVPDGWTASESDSGSVVYLGSSTVRVSISMVAKNDRSLYEMARLAYTEYSGVGEMSHGSDGLYSFSSTIGTNALILVFDNEYASNINDDWCSIVLLRGSVISQEDLFTILGSITLNENWLYNHGIEDTSDQATEQTFTKMSVKVPGGWTATENNTGDIVYIAHDGTPVSRVIIWLIENNGRTLEEVANYAYEELNGSNGPSLQNGKVYTFNVERLGAFVMDHQTVSGIPEGYSCVVYISGSNPENLSAIIQSIKVNTSGTGGNGNNNGGNGGNNNNGGDGGNNNNGGNGNNNNGGNNNNNGGNDNTSNVSGGSGGGCNSGLSALVLVLLGFALTRKK